MTIVTGAINIANAVGLNRRQVYALAEKGKAPVRNVAGLGLVADPQELKVWLLGKHNQTDVPKENR